MGRSRERASTKVRGRPTAKATVALRPGSRPFNRQDSTNAELGMKHGDPGTQSSRFSGAKGFGKPNPPSAVAPASSAAVVSRNWPEQAVNA